MVRAGSGQALCVDHSRYHCRMALISAIIHLYETLLFLSIQFLFLVLVLVVFVFVLFGWFVFWGVCCCFLFLFLLLLLLFWDCRGGFVYLFAFVLLGLNESDISCIDSGTASTVSSHFNQPLQRTGLNG